MPCATNTHRELRIGMFLICGFLKKLDASLIIVVIEKHMNRHQKYQGQIFQ